MVFSVVSLKYKFPIVPKAKEMHFRIMNYISPCREFMQLKFNIVINEFTFCESGTELAEHLSLSCNKAGLFWKDFLCWIVGNNLNMPALIYSNIKFEFVIEDGKFEFLFVFSKSEVASLVEWWKINNLTFNTEETKEKIVGNEKEEENTPAAAQPWAIFLGIYISGDLTWTLHTTHLVNSAEAVDI